MHRFAPVVVAMLATSCAQAVDIEQEKAALMAADAEWARTAGDPEKMMSFVAPDATFGMAGMPEVKGDKAIRELFAGMSQAPGFKLTSRATRAEVSAAGDIGYTAGTYELTANNAANMPVTEKGKYLSAWKKINGSWKVAEEFGSGDAPVPFSSPGLVMPASALKWLDGPAHLPPGARLAIISGDPGKPEPFTVRLQFPNGYRVAPHTHPADEHVTVLSGTLASGMGNTFDEKGLTDLGPGSYAVLTAPMPHYAMARGATVVQVSGIGPFVVNYVNPADDPRK